MPHVSLSSMPPLVEEKDLDEPVPEESVGESNQWTKGISKAKRRSWGRGPCHNHIINHALEIRDIIYKEIK